MSAVALPASTLLTPLSPMQTNVDITTLQTLTVPAGANYATVTIEGASSRYSTDGTTTPTTSAGELVTAGQSLSLAGTKVLANFQIIGSTGALMTVSYYKF